MRGETRQIWGNWLVGLATAMLCAATAQEMLLAQKPSAPSRSVRDGVFSAAQATRGEGSYLEECARCHSENLSGGENNTPALIGEEFTKVNDGFTMNDVFERIRVSMPKESPGRLSRQKYVDVLAFIISRNGYAAGDNELVHDAAALRKIRFEPPE